MYLEAALSQFNSAFINADMEYGSLKITEDGYLLLKGQTQFYYCADIVYPAAKKGSKGKQMIHELGDKDQDLYLGLKELRKKLLQKDPFLLMSFFPIKALLIWHKISL